MKPFSQGFCYPFRSLRLLRQHPRLLPYIVIPFAINLLVFTLVLWFGLDLFHELLTSWLPVGDAWYWVVLRYLAWTLAGGVTLVLVFFSFVVVGGIIAAPFNELLCERVEAVLRGGTVTAPLGTTGLLRDIGRSMLREVQRIWLFVAGMLALLLLYLLPLVGMVLHPLLSFLFMIYFLVVEYTGYVFDRKGYTFRRQRQYLRGRRRLAFGFGFGVFCLLSVPLLNLLTMPLAVVGATMLYCDHPTEDDPNPGSRPQVQA